MDDLYGPRGRYFRRDSHGIAHAAACEYPQARGSSGRSTTHRKPVIESSLSQSSMQKRCWALAAAASEHVAVVDVWSVMYDAVKGDERQLDKF